MIVDITNYGAVSQGGLCTKEIQNAIDDCFMNGGGEVIIPKGVFHTGGLRLRSNITLHLLEDAILMGSVNPEDYVGYINDKIEPIPEEERNLVAPTVKPGTRSRSVIPFSRWNNAIIRAIRAKNVSIIGETGSEINGQNCFDRQGEEDYRGPHAINMWFCENITLDGYTVRDSANWAHAIQNSREITARNLTVLGGHDGFDVRTCDNVLIENCKFITGDDAIAGFDNIGVTVRNCYFESACSCFRFGGSDVLIENCHSTAPTAYGFRGSLTDSEKCERKDSFKYGRRTCLYVFTYYCDGRANIRKTPGNILIKNSRFKNPNAVMQLPFGHIWCCNRSLEDITFENCVIEGVCYPIQIKAPKEEPLTLNMKNCIVSPREGSENIPFLEGENIKKLTLDGVSYVGFKNPQIICDSYTAGNEGEE